MPELPEVETIRRDLEPLLVGRRIVRVEVDPATLHLLAGIPMDGLTAQLEGRTFVSAGRRGKYLLFGLDDGRTFCVHLRMTGRLLWRKHDDPEEKYERAKLVLDDEHDLRWSDLRKFGTWRLFDSPEEITKKLGPEPIDEGFTFAQFVAAVKNRTAPIKAVLLDQRRVAGLGNIYVDEALYEAKVRPDTSANLVSTPDLKRLWASSRSVLERAIENRGATFSDFVDGQGNAGSHQFHVQVFRRTGKPCYACGTPIERIVVGGRSTHFCPKCQPRARRRAVKHVD